MEEISNRFDNLRVPVSANEREKGTTPYYGANGIQDYVKGFTHNGEYVLIAEDGANDLKNYPVKYVNGLFWANNHVHVVQGKEGICDNKYLKYCFTKTSIESLLVGGGRAKLNANIMMSIDLTVPSFNEQVELGRMFYELDNLITLHQSKYDKLVNVKKALLEKMFPKEGKNVPEIRFKGFTDTWEQRKLNDVYTFSQGMQVEIENQAFDKKDNMEQFLRIIDITQSNEPPRYIYNKSGKGHVEKDDIFFVRYGAVGTIGYGYTGTIANNLFKLSTSEKYDNNFMFQQFSNGNFNKKLVEMSASTSMPAINFTALKNLDFFITTNDEQKEIGSFFSKLDNLITLHQHKLEKLQNIKKSLLNKMFV